MPMQGITCRDNGLIPNDIERWRACKRIYAINKYMRVSNLSFVECTPDILNESVRMGAVQ